MSIYNLIIVVLWLGFFVYWTISAAKVKLALQLLIMFFALFLFSKWMSILTIQETSENPLIKIVGISLCCLGLFFAVLARLHLGKNWSMPMTFKENFELVTSGPYRFVRHPIYSGLLLAILGSGLAGDLIWLIIFPIFIFYFIYSAKTEEQLISRKIPQYSEYKKRTKMIIPFLF
jgi:protein-S-isoprenylcysteine O-methyltransferase Ste14